MAGLRLASLGMAPAGDDGALRMVPARGCVWGDRERAEGLAARAALVVGLLAG
jgi:hypothetical protein